MEFEYVVDSKTDVKSFLLNKKFSKKAINKLLLEKKDIFINGLVYSGNYTLNVNDTLKITVNEDDTTVKPVDKPINVVYEDEYILVVNKESGLSVIPSFAHYEDNLAGRVLAYLNGKNQNVGIHVVNRLDLLTKGLVVFAKSKYVHNLLSKTQITKKYRCTVNGILECKNGVISANIDRMGDSIKRQVIKSGKNAVTVYNVLKENNGNSVLDVQLKTGRTHQIRVHLAYIGHPLVGDNLYGGGNGEFDLCSYYLSFTLPVNNKQYEFKI